MSTKSKHKIIIGNLLLILGTILLIIWMFSFYYYPHRVDNVRTVNFIWLIGLLIPILSVVLGFTKVFESEKYKGLDWENKTIITYLLRRKTNGSGEKT